jgi:hypothetical protein
MGALLPMARFPALASSPGIRRIRPGDQSWPKPTDWQQLNQAVKGRLIKIKSLLLDCEEQSNIAECNSVLHNLHNPYFLGEQPAGTESSGWVDAWQSAPSAYAVAARTTADVVAAVNFARQHHLRLVVKGGGHSYLGGSNAPDSLLVWMRWTDSIELHENFVPRWCSGQSSGTPAVSIGTGARWMPVYDAVTTKAGRYVQGGGCTTVGVAGHVLGNGFGSFSKHYGAAGAALLEAEIVTADGTVRVANECMNPDLFWALKGGGSCSFGVVTRLTLRTRSLPEYFGLAFGKIKAHSEEAFQRLISNFTEFYSRSLFNLHWGESVVLGSDNTLTLQLVFYDLTQEQARSTFEPLIDFAKTTPADYTFAEPMKIEGVPARHWWDSVYLSKNMPSIVAQDPRNGAPQADIWYKGDAGQAGWFIHGYESAWLPASLLTEDARKKLDEMLFSATRQWHVALHFNKGLAGAPPDAIAATRNTPMNPAVTEAFALAIIAGGGKPNFHGMPGNGPNLTLARKQAAAISRAIGVVRDLIPDAGSYVSEAGFSDPEWRQRCFGDNYARLSNIKRRYDPDDLFITHHGVGSERWSQDGFTPV